MNRLNRENCFFSHVQVKFAVKLKISLNFLQLNLYILNLLVIMKEDVKANQEKKKDKDE